MKSYTNLEQSKKLAEILSIESADMQWIIDGLGEPFPFPVDDRVNESEEPCWSLSALLNVLPDTMLGKDKDGYVVMVETMGSGQTTFASNSIDACYEMILKLHEQKML